VPSHASISFNPISLIDLFLSDFLIDHVIKICPVYLSLSTSIPHIRYGSKIFLCGMLLAHWSVLFYPSTWRSLNLYTQYYVFFFTFQFTVIDAAVLLSL
jgi:hypothetical protein